MNQIASIIYQEKNLSNFDKDLLDELIKNLINNEIMKK